MGTDRWQPLTRDELDSMISIALSQYDQEVGSDWERIKIEPAKWQCSPLGDLGGGFWAVAIENGNVLWYNDIEEGFNWSPFKERGIIDEYWCNQNEFDAILEGFAQARSKQAWQSITPSKVPNVMKGPGHIRQRQTTYWDIENSLGERYRIHFQNKKEFVFAGSTYEEALLLNQHPVLQNYKQPIQTIMISARAPNPAEVTRKLDDEVRAQTKGWRSLIEYANMDTTELLRGGHGVLMHAPESVCAALLPLLDTLGAKPYYGPGGSTVRGANKCVLLLGQSFVIAEAFSFVRMGLFPSLHRHLS